jgi:lambda family phage portal protein
MANPFRAAARQMPPLQQRGRRASTWDGADTGRLYADWSTWTTSPDFEIRFNFRLLRARARDFARNNPWMVGFLDELANNVVGPHGILLQAQIKNALGKLAKATNDEIEAGWEEWGYPENASADGHDSWIELQRLIIQTIAIDGECFVRRIRGADNPFGYTLQLIDADLVDETYNQPAAPNTNRIRMGVELDRYSRPVAYWIYNRYAEDMDGLERKRERVSADEISHLFIRWHRGNTTRGITWFAPIVAPARHLDQYELNHIVASRGAAAKMAVIINKHPEAIAAYEPPKKGEQPRVFEMEPGTMPELLPGQEIQTVDPAFPSQNYGDFVVAVLRAISRGLKVSYLTLTGDLRQANYSSMRAGLLPERDRWKALQVWFATNAHRVFYREWVDMAALKRAIAVDGRLGSDYYAVVWRGRGWKWVDPKNDLEALEKEIKLGINSRTRAAADQGRDYEDVIDEQEQELEYADDHGVDVSVPVKGETPLPAAQPEGAAGSGNAPEETTTDSTDTGTAGARRLAAVS